MKVRDLMSYPIVTVPPEATVLEAVRKMGREKKGSLLVARGGLLKECLGIVTTSLIFHRVFAEGRDPGRVSVSEIMTQGPLVTIDLNSACVLCDCDHGLSNILNTLAGGSDIFDHMISIFFCPSSRLAG